MRQVAFIRQQKLGFQTLEAAEFEELRPLLVKVEQAQGNRDFAAFLQQGNPADAFFKASCRFVNVNSTSLSSCCPNIHLTVMMCAWERLSCSNKKRVQLIGWCMEVSGELTYEQRHRRLVSAGGHPCSQAAQPASRRKGSCCVQTAIRLCCLLQVEFERVPDLVAQRKVLLRKGWSYVSRWACALASPRAVLSIRRPADLRCKSTPHLAKYVTCFPVWLAVCLH